MVHRTDTNGFEHPRKAPLHHPPIFQHVAHPARTTAVVLEHHIFAFVAADQIRAAHVDVNVLWHRKVHKLPPEMFARQHTLRWNYTVFDDPLLVVDVMEEQIERGDALRQTSLEELPLPGRDDSWDQIEGKNALGPP